MKVKLSFAVPLVAVCLLVRGADGGSSGAGAGNPPDEVFSACPAVYAVGHEYQIMAPVRKETVMWCEVNGRRYYDDSNGILRSAVSTHRMAVPMEEIDRAGGYSICYRIVEERKAYFSKTGEVRRAEFRFRPLRDGSRVRIFHVADSHGLREGPVKAAETCRGKLDLLVVNGDIYDSCNGPDAFMTIHIIAGGISRGEIPVVFSRGNHDLRGCFAEKLEDHVPTSNGKSYFTFRLGPVWGIVLDGAEDKPDDHPAYGHTNACHEFRIRETEFLRKVVADASGEYDAPGVRYRLVVTHMPFTEYLYVDTDIFRQWNRLLKQHIHPHLILAGHQHDLYVTLPGDKRDHYKEQPCPVVVGATPGEKYNHFSGCALELTPGKARVRFIDEDHRIVGERRLDMIP